MPKTTMDYSKCIIYKIVCNDLSVSNFYIGHTTNFKQRKSAHRTACNCESGSGYNTILYQTMRANGGRDNWKMIEIEKYSCKDFNEACARERYWIETLKPTLNTMRPFVTEEERLSKQKQYLEEHKEERNAKQKQYREKLIADNDEFYKMHYDKYKTQIKERVKKYKEEHKEEINAKQKEKITCECGIICSKSNISQHYKSKTHQHHLASQNNHSL
jgi:hypothetical protein